MSFDIRARLPGTPQPATITIADPSAAISTLYDQVSAVSKIPVDELKIMAGYPPKDVRDRISDAISSVFRKNDVVVVQKGEAVMKQGRTGGKYIPPAPENAGFVLREMPGDNSCFFHAMAYVMENKASGKEEANKMRLKAAEFVYNHPEILTPALLGMPTKQYVEWLLKPDSWGGELELLVFSLMYNCEIVAVDLQSLRLHHMGSDKGYTTRVFVVYTGIHYDAIAATQGGGMMSGDDQVMFSTTDQRCFDKATHWIKYELAKKKGK